MKQKCRKISYVFPWCRHDKFFAGKSQENTVIKIKSYADIDRDRTTIGRYGLLN
ncbi:hypothetical protein J6590_096677 [Homalodisca vitripennis]|nr:hypothetical protein J6590_096677 [Homalodisca vitripennis]